MSLRRSVREVMKGKGSNEFRGASKLGEQYARGPVKKG